MIDVIIIIISILISLIITVALYIVTIMTQKYNRITTSNGSRIDIVASNDRIVGADFARGNDYGTSRYIIEGDLLSEELMDYEVPPHTRNEPTEHIEEIVSPSGCTNHEKGIVGYSGKTVEYGCIHCGKAMR